jgi:hypothetical protein
VLSLPVRNVAQGLNDFMILYNSLSLSYIIKNGHINLFYQFFCMEGQQNITIHYDYEQEPTKFTKINLDDRKDDEKKEEEPMRTIGLSATSCGDEKRNIYKIIENKLSKPAS